jgi:hypothetical protein
MELKEAVAFYESRRPGLGATFATEVEATIARILQKPARFRIVEQDVHTCRTHTFPYAILYVCRHSSILILAVAHLRRRPGYW